MTPDEVRKHVLEIQARAEKAPPGPWAWCITGDYLRQVRIGDAYGPWIGNTRSTATDFIASARTDVPWLCEQLLESLVREEALRSLRSNELKIVSSKEPFIGNVR